MASRAGLRCGRITHLVQAGGWMMEGAVGGGEAAATSKPSKNCVLSSGKERARCKDAGARRAAAAAEAEAEAVFRQRNATSEGFVATSCF